MIPGVGQDDVVRIRRSRAKLVWVLAIAIGFVATCVGFLVPLAIGAKIIGILGAVLFSCVALKALIELVVPRDLMVIGPDGVYQRAVRPHVLIPWHEITDIGVIERSGDDAWSRGSRPFAIPTAGSAQSVAQQSLCPEVDETAARRIATDVRGTGRSRGRGPHARCRYLLSRDL